MFHLNIYKLSLLSGLKEENSRDSRWKLKTDIKKYTGQGTLFHRIFDLRDEKIHRVKEIFHQVSSLSKAFVYRKYIMFAQCIWTNISLCIGTSLLIHIEEEGDLSFWTCALSQLYFVQKKYVQMNRNESCFRSFI